MSDRAWIQRFQGRARRAAGDAEHALDELAFLLEIS